MARNTLNKNEIIAIAVILFSNGLKFMVYNMLYCAFVSKAICNHSV